MSENLSSVLDVMDAVADERRLGFETILDIGSPESTLPLFRDLFLASRRPDRQKFRGLLEDTDRILRNYNVQRSVNDWPFENFWGTRVVEPRHSKLLGFFIDLDSGKVGHQCGRFLLNELLKALIPDHAFNLDGCSVDAEIKHSKYGQVDILIRRQIGEVSDFGVIVENKVNNASDGERQLERYVSWLIDDENLIPSQIYVRYLPLTPEKRPNADDVAAIKSKGVDFAEVSFKEHILTWLDAVMENWPRDLDRAMLDNIRHYRNFVRYLVNNKYRKLRMNIDILKKLEISRIDIPSLAAGIEQLKASAVSLDECLRCARIGALLMAVRRHLKNIGVETSEAWFCLDGEPSGRIEPESHFDSCFNPGVDLCLAVNEQVTVCLGGSLQDLKDGFWLGFMKRAGGDVSKELERAVHLEALEFSMKAELHPNDPWFHWWWHPLDLFDGCEQHLAPALAEELVEMRDALRKRMSSAGL